MTETFLILFREFLEISIILSVIVAATRGIAGRTQWIVIGISGGILGSAIVAYFAGNIAMAMEGMGQEVFNALILSIAVFMIGWTVVWMQKHGRELSQKLKSVGRKVSDGELPLYALATVISVTMWREGSEIVLFMYGILNTSGDSLAAIITGGIAGTLTAITIGALLYFGLIRLSMKHVLSVSSALLILLAAGMSAQVAGYLIAADMLPALSPALWDSGNLLSENSLMGRVLHAMLGYTERPAGMQAIFYVATLGIILSMARMFKSTISRPDPVLPR